MTAKTVTGGAWDVSGFDVTNPPAVLPEPPSRPYPPLDEMIGRKVELHIGDRSVFCRVIIDGHEVMARSVRVESHADDGYPAVWVELGPKELTFF